MNMSNDIIRIIDLRGKKLSRAQLLEAMPRAQMSVEKTTELVGPVLEDVKNRGAAALRDFSEKFDAVRPENLRVLCVSWNRECARRLKSLCADAER